MRYTLTYCDFVAQLTVIGIDHVICVPESNVEFVHFVWDNVEHFYCTRYFFNLLHTYDDFVGDTVRYSLTYGDFVAQLTVIGIDYVLCVPESNVEFVHFVWDNGEHFYCTRYSINLFRPYDDPKSFTRTLYIAHHKSESDGWRNRIDCKVCRSDFLGGIIYLTYYCIFPSGPCQYTVCRRQHHSHANSAANILFHLTFNMDNFELTADTTYDLYLYGVRSLGSANVGTSHFSFSSIASRTVHTSRKADDIVTVREVAVIILGWVHEPKLLLPYQNHRYSGFI